MSQWEGQKQTNTLIVPSENVEQDNNENLENESIDENIKKTAEFLIGRSNFKKPILPKDDVQLDLEWRSFLSQPCPRKTRGFYGVPMMGIPKLAEVVDGQNKLRQNEVTIKDIYYYIPYMIKM